MKICSLILFPLMLIQAFAFEGVVEYRIHSGDRDWKMLSYFKDGYSKSEIYLGDTLFQSILYNSEGEFLIDEMNKQVFLTDYERKKWGTKKDLDKKKESKNKLVGDFAEDGFSGKIYSVRYKRKNYHLKIAENIGYVPGFFMDQFSSMWGFAYDATPAFKELLGAPVSIYPEKKSKKPILELVSSRAESVSEEKFKISEDYIRAKMRFKMR